MIHILVFFSGKNYLVIHFELKCSVRIDILFFICGSGFWRFYLGQGLGLWVCFFFLMWHPEHD